MTGSNISVLQASQVARSGEINWYSPDIWAFSLVIFVAAVIGKMFGAMLLRENLSSRLMVGMSMIPRGEVGLIFAEIGHHSGIFNAEVHAGMVIVIILTTIIPPLVMKWFHRKYSHHLSA